MLKKINRKLSKYNDVRVKHCAEQIQELLSNKDIKIYPGLNFVLRISSLLVLVLSYLRIIENFFLSPLKK